MKYFKIKDKYVNLEQFSVVSVLSESGGEHDLHFQGVDDRFSFYLSFATAHERQQYIDDLETFLNKNQ